MANKKKQTKWGIVLDKDKQFVAKDSGKPAWSYDRAKADDLAEMMGGRVVDMEEWIKDPQYQSSASASGHLSCGPWEVGVELASNVKVDVTKVAIKKVSFKRGGRRATGAHLAIIEIEYETAP